MVAVDKRKELGWWLRDIRKRRGYSLTGAARRLGYATKGTLTNIECGIASIPIEQIHPIARLYEIDLTEFLKKLEECQPDLYRKFSILEKNFRDDFMALLTRAPMNRSSLISGRGPDGEQVARHHVPYPTSEVDRLYIIRSYGPEEDGASLFPVIPPDYYQMQQTAFEFPPPKSQELSAKIIPFPIAHSIPSDIRRSA